MGIRSAVVWDESLTEYDLGGQHPLHPVRLDLTMRLSRSLGLLDGVETLTPEVAGDSQLSRVHDPEYIAAVRAAPMIGEEVGHGLGSEDNPIFDRMHEASARIVGGSILAAEQIVTGAAERAVNLAGGLHHAMRERAAGFCVYNDAAAAIAWMLEQGVERIAYLDVDVHHGDGVQAAFYDDPRVLTLSVHQHPYTLWPWTGFASEVGSEPGDGRAVNVALPPGTQDAEWLRALHAVVPSLLNTFRPQVLVTQCGADTHQEDPLADLALSVDGQRACYQMLRGWAQRFADGKWLVLGGGGYSLFRVVPRSWTHLLATVLNRDLAPNTAIPQDWIAHVLRKSNVAAPTTLTDDHDPGFTPWSGVTTSPVDTSVRDTRHAVFPLHGLDPMDCRD